MKRDVLILLICVLLAACQPEILLAPATIVPPAIDTIVATQTRTKTPVHSPAFRPTATIWPTLTPPPKGTLLQPLVTAPDIAVQGWSPDGRYLAYWVFDEPALQMWGLRPGKLHFYDVRLGKTCPYPHPASMFLGWEEPSLLWQPDGKIQVLHGENEDDPARSGLPCSADFAVVSRPPGTLPSSVSLSPDGTYRANSQTIGEDDWVETQVINTTTEQAKNKVKWRFQGSVCGLCGFSNWLQWVDNDRLLIPQTLDQGPLLVVVGDRSIPIAQEWFEQPFQFKDPFSPDRDLYLTARGSKDPTTGAEHYVLYYDTDSKQAE